MLVEKLKNIRHKILVDLEPSINEFEDLLNTLKNNPDSQDAKAADKELLTSEFLGLVSLIGIKFDSYSYFLRANYLSLCDYIGQHDPESIDQLQKEIAEMKKKLLNTCDCDLCNDVKFKENEIYYMDLARKLYHDSIKGKK